MANVPSVPLVPPSGPDLVATLNDRIRRINAAFAQLGAESSPGVKVAPFAGQPMGLSQSDEGLLWVVSDYQHVLAWTGTGWEFADAPGGYIAGCAFAPAGTGWKLCDGSKTTYLALTAAGVAQQTTFTTPALTTSAAYLKWASSYAGSVIAATAPGTTKSGATSTGSAFVASVDNTGEPAHFGLIPYFRR